VTTYAERLAARSKTLCTIYDFPSQGARFVSQMHAGISPVDEFVEAAINGGMESWSSSTNLFTWNENLGSGEVSVHQDAAIAPDGGIYSTRIDRTGGSNFGGITENLTGFTAGSRHRVRFWHKQDAIGGTMTQACRLRILNVTQGLYCTNDGVTWQVATADAISQQGAIDPTLYEFDFTIPAGFLPTDSIEFALAPYFTAGHSVWYDAFEIHPIWDYVFVGAVPQTDDGTQLDVTAASITVGGASFEIADRAANLTAWLARFDSTLRLAPVLRRQGFVGVNESEYQVSRWQFEDYKVAGTGGGYILMLANVLKAMGQSIYEDFDGESYRLDDATYPSGLGSATTTITLDKSPKGIWREPGYAVLYDRERGIFELITYQTIGGTGDLDLQTCVRRKYGVGTSSFLYAPEPTEIYQVWVKRGNPLDIMLEWLTTTDAVAANGAHDTGDGDGIGDRVAEDYLDVDGIHAVRDEFWPVPTFAGDAKTAGTAVLFVEKSPISDIKVWIEKHILLPFGLFPVMGADERFGIDTYFRTPPVTTIVDDEWRVSDFQPSGWKRGWDDRQNNLSMQTDWAPGPDKMVFQKPKIQPTSIERFGKAKPLEMLGRGHRTGRSGFPDYASASDIEIAATRVMLALGNPGTALTVRLFYKFKDVSIGELVRLNIPIVPDVLRGIRGLTESLHLITRRRVADDKGYVELAVRQRRTVLRPAFVAPDSLVSTTYTAANETERQFAFLTPNDDAKFANDDESYTVAP